MKPNTALGLILAGMALACLAPLEAGRARIFVGRTFAGLLSALAVSTLLAFALGQSLGIDRILFHDAPQPADTHGPGRMAPITAMHFLLLALAIPFLDTEPTRNQRPAQYVGLVGIALCTIGLLSYLFGTPVPHRFSPFATVALHTTFAFTLLWAGVLLARPTKGFVAEVTSPDEGGALARRLLPPAILACAILGFVRVLGQRAGLYGWEFGVALFGTANIVVFAVLVWEGARWLNRFDADRRVAQEQRALSDERYRRFFEQNLAGACITRPNGAILDCNPAFARIFGFPSIHEAIGTDIADLYDRAHTSALLHRLRQERSLQGIEMEMRRRDGESVSVVADIVGGFDQAGELVEVRGYAQDVTEQRRVELQFQRAQKLDAIGQLAGGVAHDFNNILTVIGAYADALLRTLGPAHPGARRLQGIRKAVDRAASLTRQLLVFSRNQPFETRVCDLNKIVEEVETMLRRLIGEDVRLVVALGPEIGRVRADTSQLEQVIVNLAVNARDAMPNGGKLIIETDEVDIDESYVRLHRDVRPGRHVVLAVSDTGEGMDARTVSKIFEPFFTTKPPGKGTGLGLSVVYGIVKRFGGHLAVHSEPGGGSTFKVYLPSLREAAEVPSAVKQDEPARTGGSETVLVLEDDEALRGIVAEMLRGAGYRVHEASNPDAAVEIARRNAGSIALLLTDVILPGRSGPITAAEILDRLPGVRVLYMSGYTGRAVQGHVPWPIDGRLIEKPFTSEALLGEVRATLDRGNAPR